jgi:hypothetical protein
MKVTVKQTPRKDIPYPKLMTAKEGLIVLMIKPKCGVVIAASSYSIGYYSDAWNMNCFRDFEGSVELQNEH